MLVNSYARPLWPAQVHVTRFSEILHYLDQGQLEGSSAGLPDVLFRLAFAQARYLTNTKLAKVRCYL